MSQPPIRCSQTFFPEWIRQAETDGPAPPSSWSPPISPHAKAVAGCAGAIPLLAHYHPSIESRLDADRFKGSIWTPMCWFPITRPPRSGQSRRTPEAGRTAITRCPVRPTRRFHYLAYHPGSGVGRIVASFLSKAPPCCLVPSFSAPVTLLVEMAREGRGLTWAPRSLIENESRLRTADARRSRELGHRDRRLPVSLARAHDQRGGGVLEHGAERAAGKKNARQGVTALDAFTASRLVCPAMLLISSTQSPMAGRRLR